MKFNLSAALLLSALSSASSIEDEAAGNQLARCFRDCEDYYGTSGSSVNDCRSNCRAGENWKRTGRDRDYKDSRNGRRRRNNHDDYYDDLEEAESNALQAMLKGMISPKDKQNLADLSKDNGGGDGGGKSDGGGGGNKSDGGGGGGNKSDGGGGGGNKSDGGDNGGKNNRSNDNDDKKNGSDDKKNNKNDDDDKKRKNDDDDKKNKDDDDDKKRKNDDDDDKKNKDDDDDDDKKSRNNSVPECVTGGKNYLRCDPDTMKSSDKETCNAIEKQVCGNNMSSMDKAYCQCIGLYEDASTQLRGASSTSFRTILKGMSASKDKHVLVDLNKDNGGGGGGKSDGGGGGGNKSDGGGGGGNKSDRGGGGGNKSDGGGKKSDGGDNGGKNNRSNDNDDKKNGSDDNKKRKNDDDDKKRKNDDDDKKRKNDDDDKKRKNDDDDKKNKDDDDDKKRKNDDDDDKKNKDDDDDDDKKSRNNSVPECVTGGKNYLRCDPDTVKSSDKETCNAIKKEVCGNNISSVDKAYCQCIGLDGTMSSSLRGVVKVSL